MPLNTQIFNHKSLMRIALVVAFIQFTNALEHMALTPVFAFMADGFSVPVSFSGYVSGMYTLGAVLSGMAAFYWIDRFNKKQFLLRNMLLLGVLTFLCTVTTHFYTLLAIRFCAGLVGGTTMGVGMSILINYAPAHLRGKMLGASYSRLVCASAVVVGYPADAQRASFSSLQTAIMYLITTLAFFLSSLLLPEHAINPQNLDRLLVISAISAAGFPVMVVILQKKLAKRAVSHKASGPPARSQ
ncbi:MFS transporter [Cronobacter turicensis]